MLRVVIADDSPIILSVLRGMLRRPEYDVLRSAANGAEAIRYVRQYTPDLVILDVSMPVLSGVEAAREIRAENPTIAIVMGTSMNDGSIDTQAKAVGAVVLRKVYKAGQLHDSIRRAQLAVT